MRAFLIGVFAFAISCLNAASISWGHTDEVSVPLSPAGGTATNYIAYLCVGTTDMAQQALASIKENRWQAPTIGLDGSVVKKNLSLYDGAAYIDYQGGSALSTDYTIGTSFYIVIMDESGKYFMMSSAKEGTLYGDQDPGQTTLWNEREFAALTNGGWETIVPEPTALALLALGVAGLALKRRVA